MTIFPRILLASALISPAFAGPYAPAAELAGSDAIAATDTRISLWATEVIVTRGLVEIDYPEGFVANYGTEPDATGPADATPDAPFPVISLGDGGSAEITFASPIGDVPGPDFAIFENGFIPNFLELAHVEVSSDGLNFYRFPSVSLTPVTANLGEGGAVDPTDVHNLAGKYLAGYGTPFDLATLRLLHPSLDIQRITRVRIIDVVGTNVQEYATRDSLGQIITDPYPTPFGSSGFDLDAVGAISATTTTFSAWNTSQGHLGTDATVTADPNQNGVQNLIEFLTGNRPLRLVGSTLTLSRLAYRSGGKLVLQGSDDLANWSVLATSSNGSPMVSTSSVLISESGDQLVETTVQLPANPPWKFFRLAAELLSPP